MGNHTNIKIAIVVGVVLVVGIMITYNLAKPDIIINLLQKKPILSSGCEAGKLCIYNLDNTDEAITATEDGVSWKLEGNCIDTSIEGLTRFNAKATRDTGYPQHGDPPFNFDPSKCFDSIIFPKSDWDREDTSIDTNHVYIFYLKNVETEGLLGELVNRNYGHV